MKRAHIQLSLKQTFALVTLLCMLFANLGAAIEWRRAAIRRRSGFLPGLRGGDPYWSTPEAQRALADIAWREKNEAASQFRATCTVAAAFYVPVVYLALRDLARWLSRRLKRRCGKDRHAFK